MIEIRWVDVGGGNLQLQQRTRLPRVDANGAFCDFTPWSNWSAVPIVHGENHAVSVVDEKCQKEITDDGWHFQKCGRPAKYEMRYESGSVLLCGLHGRRYIGDERLKSVDTSGGQSDDATNQRNRLR